MNGRFTVVRHEDFLTAKGLIKFVYQMRSLLNLRKVEGNVTEIAHEMANYSRKCEGKSELPNFIKDYIRNLMTLFNYNTMD